MHRLRIDGTTVHGFRSAFRDWCGEVTPFPRELAEAALAHVAGDATERAYRRGDALEKRRKLMEAWGSLASQGRSRMSFIWRVRYAVDEHLWICSHGSG